jgi:hypothetical protein
MSMTKEYGPSTAYTHGVFAPITFVVTSTEQVEMIMKCLCQQVVQAKF